MASVKTTEYHLRTTPEGYECYIYQTYFSGGPSPASPTADQLEDVVTRIAVNEDTGDITLTEL